MQKDSAPPAKPWNPGPNSVVRISAGSQSPYHNLYAGGNLGLHMPNSGDYNGFGVALPAAWKAETTERLFVSFDFRCAGMDAGGSGSWRYYLGHGPGNSAAVELFFNGSEFFRRSGNVHDAVQPLKIGEWYQVQAALNLKERSYTGFIASASSRTEFTGRFATGWGGSIDYSFIDSYGHIGGVKPALDADNFAVGTNPLPSFEAAETRIAGDGRASRQARIEELRQQAAQLSADEENRKQEARRQFITGPVDLAYGVSEGTPHDARIHIRGEPDKPGEAVRRGFIKALGHAELPHGTTGSGRLELAQWLTRADNPLTARVMVNRLWQYHFGRFSRDAIRPARLVDQGDAPADHAERDVPAGVGKQRRHAGVRTVHALSPPAPQCGGNPGQYSRGERRT
ncbi:MAG: DUF1553 domain-containing protein [Sphingomonadales bacterium]|nr:MAG: DUF1553 domain-containing protein [Sphingomonadales bacterium]